MDIEALVAHIVFPIIIVGIILGNILYVKGLVNDKRGTGGKGLKIAGIAVSVFSGLLLTGCSINLYISTTFYFAITVGILFLALLYLTLHLLIRGYTLKDKELIKNGWAIFTANLFVFLVLSVLLLIVWFLSSPIIIGM